MVSFVKEYCRRKNKKIERNEIGRKRKKCRKREGK
jgi:hypothetical protein